jgi:hypothetical protein
MKKFMPMPKKKESRPANASTSSLRPIAGKLPTLVGKGVPERDDGVPVLLEQVLVLLDPVGAESSHELLAEVAALTVVGLGH